MHGISIRERLSKKIHKFSDGKPLCNQLNTIKDPEAAWKGLPEKQCKKCLRILKKNSVKRPKKGTMIQVPFFFLLSD